MKNLTQNQINEAKVKFIELLDNAFLEYEKADIQADIRFANGLRDGIKKSMEVFYELIGEPMPKIYELRKELELC